ncbi:MAG: rod shape-determining protein MreD [Bacteroidota bacterium]|nr:rod shape-determining protein MreD [Bacteroidota bacterium]
MRPELRIHLWYAGMMLTLVLLQVSFVPLIAMGGVLPSFPLIGLTFIALREGATPGMLYAFPSGLMVDLYMGEVVGISSLALVAGAFTIGLFYDAEKSARIIRSPRAVALAFLAAAVYGLFYVFAYFQSLSFNLVDTLLHHVLASALYTAVLSTIPVLILARTGSRLKV